MELYIQFMIEDQSSAVLIDLLMEKLTQTYPDFTWDTKAFRGIGGFTPKNTVKETKTGKLLNDLATYLSAFDKRLKGFAAAVFVVVDNDTRETERFRFELEQVASRKGITIDHVFCIAVEEVEAWLLGDRPVRKTVCLERLYTGFHLWDVGTPRGCRLSRRHPQAQKRLPHLYRNGGNKG